MNPPELDSNVHSVETEADMGRKKKTRPLSVWLPTDDGVESFGLLGAEDSENEPGECRKCARPTQMIIDVSTTSGVEFRQYVCTQCIGGAAQDLQDARVATHAKRRADAIAYRVAPLLRAEWRLHTLTHPRTFTVEPLEEPQVFPYAIEVRGERPMEWVRLGLARSLAEAVEMLAPITADLAERGIALVQVPE